MDEDYMYTSFFDDFNNANLPGWHAGLIYRGIGQLIDSSLTHNVQNGNLELSMIHVNGYNDSANYVGAEFITDKDFSFGIFECEASFAQGLGSWPAFWAFHSDCLNNEGSEIDFAEYFGRYVTPPATNEIGHYIHHWLCGGGGEVSTNYQYDYVFWPTTNIYKCIWTPDKVEFYIDGVKKTTFYNNGQDWFPLSKMKVYVSQQIIAPAGGYTPLAPQTSYFNWVKVSEYFQPPVITCPNIICSTTTATMDVDEAATNITWTLSPGYPFSGNLSGTGKTATIIPSSTEHGKGKITWTFDMPSGESFSVEKEIRVNGPGYEDVYLNICKATGESVPKVGGHYLLCPNTHYHITLMNDFGACTLSDYDWSTLPSAWSLNYYYNNMISVYSNSNPGGMIEVEATTCCGMDTKVLTDYVGQYYNCGGYYSMAISPNPVTSETTIFLESNSEEIVFDEDTEWELAVYDQSQLEKEKKTKIKGKEAKIRTAGWKKGIYYVRVKYKDEILTGKLSVEE